MFILWNKGIITIIFQDKGMTWFSWMSETKVETISSTSPILKILKSSEATLYFTVSLDHTGIHQEINVFVHCRGVKH